MDFFWRLIIDFLETLLGYFTRKQIYGAEIIYPSQLDGDGQRYLSIKHAIDMRRDNEPWIMMYLREADVQLNKLLFEKRLVAVEGPPGSGKSLSVWRFALEYARLHPQKRVVWMNDPFGDVTILHRNMLRRYLYKDYFIHSTDVLIVDGILFQHRYYHHLRQFGRLRSGGKLVLITSERLNMKSDDIEDNGGDVFTFPVWMLEEYKSACNYPEFFRSVAKSLGAEVAPVVRQAKPYAQAPCMDDFGPPTVDLPAPLPIHVPGIAALDYSNSNIRNQLIGHKYYYAGHCCRYMFDSGYSIMVVKEEILDYCCEVGNLEDALCRIHNRVNAEDACNHLFVTLVVSGRRTYCYEPISQYAARRLIGKMNHDCFLHFSQFSNDNTRKKSIVNGVMLAMDVGKALKEKTMHKRVRKVVFLDGRYQLSAETADLDFLVDVTVKYKDEWHVPNAGINFEPNTCFIPDSKCPSSFDFVQLLRRRGQKHYVLRFLYVTPQAKHTINLHSITTFVANFNIGRSAATIPPPVLSYEVAIITTEEHAVLCKNNPPLIEGTLVNWDSSQLQCYAFRRIHTQ